MIAGARSWMSMVVIKESTFSFSKIDRVFSLRTAKTDLA